MNLNINNNLIYSLKTSQFRHFLLNYSFLMNFDYILFISISLHNISTTEALPSTKSLTSPNTSSSSIKHRNSSTMFDYSKENLAEYVNRFACGTPKINPPSQSDELFDDWIRQTEKEGANRKKKKAKKNCLDFDNNGGWCIQPGHGGGYSLEISDIDDISWPVTIPVYWHTIQAGGVGSKGNISLAQIQKTIHVLNNDFNQTQSFKFQLVDVEWIENRDWFKQWGPSQDQEKYMKRTLRKGGANTLNIYSVDFVQDMLGYSYFPWQYREQPYLDGLVINFDAIVSGEAHMFNLKKVVTHETGHWLGLFHTFENGCSKENDLVEDTRPQKQTSSMTCPSNQVSCAATDFIHDLEFFYSFNSKYPFDSTRNIMDYGPDECLNEFTPGQVSRMREQWKYRQS